MSRVEGNEEQDLYANLQEQDFVGYDQQLPDIEGKCPLIILNPTKDIVYFVAMHA